MVQTLPPVAVALSYALLLAMFIAAFLFLKRCGDRDLAQRQELSASDLLDAALACDGYEQLARTLQLTQHLRARALRQKCVELKAQVRIEVEPRLEVVSGLTEQAFDVVHRYGPPPANNLTNSTMSTTTSTR